MPVCPILAFTTPGEIDVWGIIGGPIETGVSGEEEERKQNFMISQLLLPSWRKEIYI